jgi:hypothetical protein
MKIKSLIGFAALSALLALASCSTQKRNRKCDCPTWNAVELPEGSHPHVRSGAAH